MWKTVVMKTNIIEYWLFDVYSVELFSCNIDFFSVEDISSESLCKFSEDE